MIYRQLLGSEFERLPTVLRDLHGRGGRLEASGIAAIQRLPGPLPRLAGFPPSGSNVPVQLEIITGNDSEIWIRRFGGRVLRTVQRVEAGCMVERLGRLRLDFEVTSADSEIRYTLRRARFLGVPLPLRIQAAERARESSWEFEVTVAGIGSYRGTMELSA